MSVDALLDFQQAPPITPVWPMRLLLVEEYTCHDCPHREWCEFAWDEWNTDGDCLAEK